MIPKFRDDRDLIWCPGWIREEEESRGHCQAGPGVSERREKGERKAPALLGRSELGRGGGKLGRGERNEAGPRGEVKGASFLFFLFILSFSILFSKAFF